MKKIREEDWKKTISSLRDEEKDVLFLMVLEHSSIAVFRIMSPRWNASFYNRISAGEHSYLARRWSTFVFIFYWFICLEMKRQEKNFLFLPVTDVFPFLLEEWKGLRTPLNVGKMIEIVERKKRGKCHLAFQTLPVAIKELSRFCGTGRPSNNLMGPPDSTVMVVIGSM